MEMPGGLGRGRLQRSDVSPGCNGRGQVRHGTVQYVKSTKIELSNRYKTTVHDYLSSDRKRHNIRIKRLPHKRHTLTQAIAVKGPGTDLRAETLHSTHESTVRRSRLIVRLGQEGLTIEHVDQRAICAYEVRASEESSDSELGQHLGEWW